MRITANYALHTFRQIAAIYVYSDLSKLTENKIVIKTKFQASVMYYFTYLIRDSSSKNGYSLSFNHFMLFQRNECRTYFTNEKIVFVGT